MSDTLVIIGPVRFSYAQVWEAKAMNEGDKPKYSVSLIIPKSNKALIKKIKDAIEAAKEAGKSTLGGKIPRNLKIPLRDGDEEREDDENYQDSFFLNASSHQRPGIVEGPNREPVMDQEDFYSGCYGYASVNFYAFNQKSKGIAAGLNNLWKTKDGEPLSGRNTAEVDFADIEIEEDTNDDLLG